MRFFCFFFSFLFCGLVNAAVPLEGWYVGLIIGATHAFDLDLNLTNPLTGQSDSGSLSYQTGVSGGGQVGYRYEKVRIEGELNFAHNNFDTIEIGTLTINTLDTSGASFSGHTNFSAAILNLYYEFYKEDAEVRFVPYVGLGIGAAEISNTLSIFYNQRQIFNRADTEYAPVGQAIIGLSYFFTDSQSVSLDYRYMSTPKHEALNSTIAAGTINFVVNFSFD